MIEHNENIFFNETEIMEKVKYWGKDNIYIVTDFDKTLTDGKSKTSWSLFTNSGNMSEDYVIERQKLFEHYRPIEIDASLSEDIRSEKMMEWWKAHLSLLVKYQLKESAIMDIIKDPDLMSFRDGAKELLSYCYENNIPVIIISAGIGNFIEGFLRYNGLLYDNVKIVSNFIKFENGLAFGFEKDIIHVANKDEQSLTDEINKMLQNREHPIMMGDGIDDVKMLSQDKRKSALKIGFLEEQIERNLIFYKSVFDIVCTDNCSLMPILELVKHI